MNQCSDRFRHHLLATYSSLESVYICKSKYRDLESVTEFYELCCFSCTACTKGTIRLPYLFAFCIIALASVCNSTNGSAVQSDKSNSNTLAVVSFYLEELSVISDSGKCNGCVACAVLNILAYTVQVVCALHVRISVFAVRWQICYEFTDFSKDLVLSADSVYKTCLFALESGRGCVTFGNVIAFKGVRGVYKQFAFLLFNKCEVCQCRYKCHTTTAGTEDTCDLWDQSGCQSLFHINFTECFQCVSCLLKTETCTIDQADHRSTGLHSHIIKSGNLLGMHFTNGSVQYGNILAVHIHQISIDYTISGNNTV